MSNKLSNRIENLLELDNRARFDPTARAFLHAYAGCLTPDGLCRALVLTLDAPINVQRAVRNRLARLDSVSDHADLFDRLGGDLLDLTRETKTRPRVDACLSHLFGRFSPAVRISILEHWYDRGTVSAGTRWLKAIVDDQILYSEHQIAEFWEVRRDPKAAIILAKKGSPDLLRNLLPSFISFGLDGWVIGKAALRAGVVSEELWLQVLETYPATYAYLCAKGQRSMTEDEAVSLVLSTANDLSGERSLAIWAVGQLGLETALDRLRAQLV